MKKCKPPEEKIVEEETISSLCSSWQNNNLSLVFTNGCFDILHRGHMEYLYKASGKGDILFIGVNSDESVHRLKGEGRPVQDQYSRALILASLEFVDYVSIFDEDTPYELIKILQPDVLVKGGDYLPEEIVGYDIVKDKNGQVITIDYIKGYSSSEIINKYKKL